MRRGFGLFLIGLGVAFLVLAPMLKFYAVPRLAVAPLDLDPNNTTNSSGTVTTVVDLATATETSNIPLLSTRRTKADVAASQQAGGNIGVYDSRSVISLASDPSAKPYLPVSPERYAFDRTTAVLVTGSGSNVGGVPITEAMIGTDTIMPLKMPFFTEKKTYNVFDSSLLKGAPADFVGEESVKGLDTYKFEQKIPATQVGMQGDQPIFYQNDTLMWVEPLTGQVVNGSSTVKQWLKNTDGTDGLVLLDGTIGFTDGEVTQTVNEATTNANKLKLVDNVLPPVLVVLGLISLVGGGFLYARSRPDSV